MTSPLQKTRTTLIGPLILNWQLLKRPIYIHKIESVYFSNLGSRNLSLGLYHWNFSYKMSTICLEGSFSRVSHLLKMLQCSTAAVSIRVFVCMGFCLSEIIVLRLCFSPGEKGVAEYFQGTIFPEISFGTLLDPFGPFLDI